MIESVEGVYDESISQEKQNINDLIAHPVQVWKRKSGKKISPLWPTQIGKE